MSSRNHMSAVCWTNTQENDTHSYGLIAALTQIKCYFVQAAHMNNGYLPNKRHQSNDMKYISVTKYWTIMV